MKKKLRKRTNQIRSNRREFAVVMGDIVGSETLRPSQKLSDQFDEAVKATNRQFHQLLASPLTITLGDEFQGLALTLSAAFQVVEHLRARLLNSSINCRFVVGVVRLDSKLNVRVAWNMVGEGLKASRAKLGNKNDPNIYRFSLPQVLLPSLPEWLSVEQLLDAAGTGLTAVESRWTDRQRAVLSLRLRGETVAKIASNSGVGTRSIYKVLTSGRLEYYENIKSVIRTTLASLDDEYRLR